MRAYFPNFSNISFVSLSLASLPRTNHPPTITKGSCPVPSPPYLLKGTYTISHLHFPSFFQHVYTLSLHNISLLFTLFIPILLVFPSASDYTKLQGKPTFLSMSCHPTGPNMAAQPLPGLPSHAGFRKGQTAKRRSWVGS